MQGGTDLVSGDWIIFQGWFSRGFGFIGNGGRSRRRRSHGERRRGSGMAVRER
jgi:hypothetical protein